VEPAALESLAVARAESIRALLVDELKTDGNRVQVLDPATVKKPSEGGRVSLELGIDTKG